MPILLRQILFRFFPHTSSSFLLKTFLQPKKYKRPQKEENTWVKGRRLVSKKGIEARLFSNKAEEPLVVFLHGWAGRGSQFYSFVQPLQERGYSVLLVDGPAHGDSKGDQTNLPHFTREIAQFLKDKKVYAMIGHSFGGLVTLYSTRLGLKVKKRILIGSPFLSQTVVDRFCKRMKIPNKLKKVFVQDLNSLAKASLKEIDAHPHFLKKDCDLLIVHDKDDREVPLDRAYSLQKKYQGSELFISKGYGHHRILKRKEIISRIMDFLDKES